MKASNGQGECPQGTAEEWIRSAGEPASFPILDGGGHARRPPSDEEIRAWYLAYEDEIEMVARRAKEQVVADIIKQYGATVYEHDSRDGFVRYFGDELLAWSESQGINTSAWDADFSDHKHAEVPLSNQELTDYLSRMTKYARDVEMLYLSMGTDPDGREWLRRFREKHRITESDLEDS